jgi:hypothetical protein
MLRRTTTVPPSEVNLRLRRRKGRNRNKHTEGTKAHSTGDGDRMSNKQDERSSSELTEYGKRRDGDRYQLCD